MCNVIRISLTPFRVVWPAAYRLLTGFPSVRILPEISQSVNFL